MTQTGQDRRRRTPKRGERGAAAVEFALIATPFFTLLFGMMLFGVLLSKRQVLTQAAAEGARAAVPYSYTSSNQDNVKTAAQLQVNQSLKAVDRQCGDGTTTCTFTVYSCAAGLAAPPTYPAAGAQDCLQVQITIQVKGTKPLVPGMGLINPLLPDVMVGTAVSRMSPP